MNYLLYLHGFCSSPKTTKAKLTQTYWENSGVQVYAPNLNMEPNRVDALLRSWAQEHQNDHWAVIGSSLGGFYAARLAKRWGRPAILLNPCIDPWELLPRYLGVQEADDGQKLEVSLHYIDDLLALHDRYSTHLPPEQHLLILGDQDELLDPQKAVRWYGTESLLWSYGDFHRLENYEAFLPKIEKYLVQVYGPSFAHDAVVEK